MQNQQKLKDSPALCMAAAGLLEDGSSTMYVAAANPLEEAALGRLNPNRGRRSATDPTVGLIIKKIPWKIIRETFNIIIHKFSSTSSNLSIFY